MARFSDVIILRHPVPKQNDEGVVTWENEDTQVFFNRYRVGLRSRLAGGSDGMRGIAEGRVYSIDYDGQELAVLDGVEYSVEDASNQGDFTVLTLTKRLANG